MPRGGRHDEASSIYSYSAAGRSGAAMVIFAVPMMPFSLFQDAGIHGVGAACYQYHLPPCARHWLTDGDAMQARWRLSTMDAVRRHARRQGLYMPMRGDFSAASISNARDNIALHNISAQAGLRGDGDEAGGYLTDGISTIHTFGRVANA